MTQTVRHTFLPGDVTLPSANAPGRGPRHYGSFSTEMLAFDDITDEIVIMHVPVVGYLSGNVDLTIDWMAQSATSGNVVWQAQVAAYTPNVDATALNSKSPDAWNWVQDTHLGSAANRPHRTVLTISNLDSLADGDFLWIRLSRDADSTHATDDLVGDADIFSVIVSYLGP